MNETGNGNPTTEEEEIRLPGEIDPTKEVRGKVTLVHLPPLELSTIHVTVVSIGEALIANRFPTEAIKGIIVNQSPEAKLMPKPRGKGSKPPKKGVDPEVAVDASLWKSADGKYLIKSRAFQKALLECAKKHFPESYLAVEGFVRVPGAFFEIQSEKPPTADLTPDGVPPTKPISGRRGGGTPVWRARFEHLWRIAFRVTFGRRAISEESLINLINYAGFTQGLAGERPGLGSGGNNGMFQVEEVHY